MMLEFKEEEVGGILGHLCMWRVHRGKESYRGNRFVGGDLELRF